MLELLFFTKIEYMLDNVLINMQKSFNENFIPKKPSNVHVLVRMRNFFTCEGFVGYVKEVNSDQRSYFVFDGPFTTHDLRSGLYTQHGNYVDGKLHGICIYYSQQCESVKTYDNGKCLPGVCYWDSTGIAEICEI